MERQPFGDQTEESSKDGSKKPDRSFSFAPVPILPVERATESQSRPPIKLEGIIRLRPDRSERPLDDPRLHPGLEAPAESHEDDEEDDDSEEAKAKRAAAQRQAAARQAQAQQPVHTFRPGVETPSPIVQPEATAQSDTEQEDEPVPARAVPPLHSFPSVATRQETPVQPTVQESIPAQRASEAPAHGQAPVAEQAGWQSPEDATDEDDTTAATTQQAAPVQSPFGNTSPNRPNPVNPNAMPQPVVAPNINPYVYANLNMPPANANVPPQPNAPGGGFNQPPVQPGYNQMPPYGPNNPFFPGYGGYNIPPQPNPNVVPTPNAVPVMPIERPIVTHNRDPRVPVVAALLGLDYLGRKRNERKARRRMDDMEADQSRLQESIAVDNRLLQERQRQFATEQQRQADELQRVRTTQEYAPAAPLATEPRPSSPFNAAPSGYERPQPIPAVYGQERSAPVRPEKMPAQTPAQNAEGQPAEMPDMHVDIRPDQRVEHSAWHNIVVDEHGHEVSGAIRYGEGFQRERQQEIIPDRIAAGSSMSASGGSADSNSMIAAGSPMQDQYGNPLHLGGLPSGTTNQALPQGSHADANHQLPAAHKQPSNLTNPWFWIMLALIVAAFFTAALI